MTASSRPLVGLLYNPAVPTVIDAAGPLVEAVEVIPDSLWYDAGIGSADRFHVVDRALARLRRSAEGRVVFGHGLGLSLPSAMPLDEELVEQVAWLAGTLGFSWYSEHLSMFLTPGGSVPSAQAGLGLPVVYDAAVLDVLGAKVVRLADALGVDVALENGTVFTPVPGTELSEPEFVNELRQASGCSLVLDLHNLYANVVNNGWDPHEYLAALDPEVVVELHFAGGDRMFGFHTDSHSRPTPAAVWEWAAEWAPRFPRLRALVYEFHESYFRRLGVDLVVGQVERMHEVAARCAAASTPVPRAGVRGAPASPAAGPP